MAPPVDSDPVDHYLARLGPGSRRSIMSALITLAVYLVGEDDPRRVPWWQLRYVHTSALRSLLARDYHPATANKHLAALRGVLRECRRLGLMTAEESLSAGDVDSVRSFWLPAGRHLPDAEMGALVACCQTEPHPIGLRNGALLALLYGAGLRRSEARGLRPADYDQTMAALVVRGKGSRERRVYLLGGAEELLDPWLALLDGESSYILCPIERQAKGAGYRIVGTRPLSTEAIYGVVTRLARRAGVGDVRPHDFRRSFVGKLLDENVDLVTVQKLVGHASVNMTARYDMRPEEVKRRAARSVRFPGLSPKPP